jgi:transcriptional regulator
MQNLDQRTIEIIAQVTYKEMCEDARTLPKTEQPISFWDKHLNNTLELARNIIKLNQRINPLK